MRVYKSFGWDVQTWGGAGGRPYNVDVYPSHEGGVPIARTRPGQECDTVREAAEWAKTQINAIIAKRKVA